MRNPLIGLLVMSGVTCWMGGDVLGDRDRTTPVGKSRKRAKEVVLNRSNRMLLMFLPLMALGLLACDTGRITGTGQLACDPDLLRGIFSYDNNEDLHRCLQGKRPITGG